MIAKFLHFYNAADDALTLPAERLVSMDQTTNTNIRLAFADDGGTSNTVDLTITAGKEKEVMQAISEAVAFGKEQFLVIADDVNSVYVDANIDAVAAVATANAGGVQYLTTTGDHDLQDNVFARNTTILVNAALADGSHIRLPEATTSNAGLTIKVLFALSPAATAHVGCVTSNLVGGLMGLSDATEGAAAGFIASSAIGTGNKRITLDVDATATPGGYPGSQITFHYTGVANTIIVEGTLLGDVDSAAGGSLFNTTAVTG